MSKIIRIKSDYKQRFKYFLLVLLLFNLVSCGFHLQQSYFIPPNLTTLNLSSQDQYSELTRVLKEQLRLNGVTLSNEKDIAQLRLVKDSLERVTLSLYPTGNVAEYELIYQVNFAIVLPKQEIKEFSVEIRRDYLDDPRTALAKTREMDLLTREMRIQAANKILQTLAQVE